MADIGTPHFYFGETLKTDSQPIMELYKYLIGTLGWDSTYTVNLINYLQESIITTLKLEHELNKFTYRKRTEEEKK